MKWHTFVRSLDNVNTRTKLCKNRGARAPYYTYIPTAKEGDKYNFDFDQQPAGILADRAHAGAQAHSVSSAGQIASPPGLPHAPRHSAPPP